MYDTNQQGFNSDQYLRMWAVEQAIKWRASTNAPMTIDGMVKKFYTWAKDGLDR